MFRCLGILGPYVSVCVARWLRLRDYFSKCVVWSRAKALCRTEEGARAEKNAIPSILHFSTSCICRSLSVYMYLYRYTPRASRVPRVPRVDWIINSGCWCLLCCMCIVCGRWDIKASSRVCFPWSELSAADAVLLIWVCLHVSLSTSVRGRLFCQSALKSVSCRLIWWRLFVQCDVVAGTGVFGQGVTVYSFLCHEVTLYSCFCVMESLYTAAFVSWSHFIRLPLSISVLFVLLCGRHMRTDVAIFIFFLSINLRVSLFILGGSIFVSVGVSI